MNGRVRRPGGLRRWSALVVVLSLFLLAAPGALALPAPPSLPPSSFALYARLSVAPEFVPLDPATLADRAGPKPLELAGASPRLLLSADGSTVVAIEYHTDAPPTIDIRDGLRGPTRWHFTLSNGAGDTWLSPDGTRLAVGSFLPSGTTIWQVFDTRTDRLLTEIPCAGRTIGPESDLFSPDGTRLYHPYVELPPAGQALPRQAQPLRIAVYDVMAGKETGRATVPGVTAGSWPRGDAVDGDPIVEVAQPAIALSPDGTRLAVIDAAGTRITLLDARTLTVTSSHALHTPESAAHRVLRWLGLAPQSVEAKFMAGQQLVTTFAPDGRHLYLAGIDTSVDIAHKSMTGKGLGVRRIDTATGAITSAALAGRQVTNLMPSPDGRSLYAVGPSVPWGTNTGGTYTFEIRRLDALTLKSLAKRTLDSPPYLVIVPVNQHE